MFGGFPFGDDFFGGVHQQMRRQMRDMDRMMNQMMDPFGVFDHRMGRAIENVGRRGNDDLALMSPFGGFGGLFGGMFDHMQNLETAAMNDPNSHIFSHSTMITFDGTNGNQPRVVEKSVRKTGDIKETRHSVRTGEQGVGDRMSIEHTIGDRTHIIEKQRDRSGRIREKQRFINLDEEEAKDFDREFTNRARYNLGTRRSHTVAAIEGREREVNGRLMEIF
ncbi:unnamed protein product [Dracunculus medinensis]|uniref:Myeloid leukemia factor n=1 Tax=Dracunculus medinensis TaxID=318479 RepID=A0A158Q5R6_DRAME|nr:unnamed protein product [Dracunculus medinensis]